MTTCLQPQADKLTTGTEKLPKANRRKMDCLNIAGPRDVAVREYSLWHKANVSDDGLKAQYRQACEVALACGLDLELILYRIGLTAMIPSIITHGKCISQCPECTEFPLDVSLVTCQC